MNFIGFCTVIGKEVLVFSYYFCEDELDQKKSYQYRIHNHQTIRKTIILKGIKDEA